MLRGCSPGNNLQHCRAQTFASVSDEARSPFREIGDLRNCLAFDAGTNVHVADLSIHTRERTETPATEAIYEEALHLLHTMLNSQGRRDVATISAGAGIPTFGLT